MLAGKVMVLVEAFSHRPLWHLDTAAALANDNALPPLSSRCPWAGGCSSTWGLSAVCGSTTAPPRRFFVTRMRKKIAYRPVGVLSQGPYYRDEIIQVGLDRSNPCHPLRMVSVLWQGAWYRYLTNILDPQTLTARQVCELYRRRWRIEDACAVTTRLLDLAYGWTGSTMPSSCRSLPH